MDRIHPEFGQFLRGLGLLVTVLYASLLQPPLPAGVKRFMNSMIGKLLGYSAIVYLATQDLTVAVIVAVGFYVTISLIHEQDMAEGFINALDTD